jgi:transcription initiation factor TFIIB
MSVDNASDLLDQLKQNKLDIDLTETETNRSQDLCLECSSTNIENLNGSLVCRDCGTMYDTILDYNAEWRFYGSDDSKFSDPTRCGLPTNSLLPQSSIGSTISFKYRESYDMKKIRNYHSWHAMPYKERSLHNVFDSIQVRAINSGLPACIIEEAKILYKQIAETKISRGANRKGIIASCIYKACSIQGCPRSTHEIADIFKIDTKNMTKGCKNFDKIMNNNKKPCISVSGSKSVDFIRRFCSYLNLGTNIYSICLHVCEEAEKNNIVSKCIPPSVASGSIFLVCSLLNINISKKDISTACKISEVTISKCYKELLKYHKYLLPKEILEKLY